jgi:hypothetical protein
MLAAIRESRAERFGANRPKRSQSMANNGAARILSTAKADQPRRKEDGSSAPEAVWITAAAALVNAAARDAMESVSQNAGVRSEEEERCA